MPFARVRDLNMYYEMRGFGPRLLYFSGTGGDLRRSPNVFDWPLGQHFEVLAFDQRGLGRTDRPDMPYTMADYAADANGLLALVGWDRCLVMGVSFGGMVAQEFALRYPQGVTRLVLACSSSGGAGGASYPLEKVAHLPLDERVRHSVAQADTRRTAEWQAANAEQWQGLVAQTLTGLKIGADEPNRQIGARRQLEARAAHDTYDRLPSLHIPVFICGGQYDGVAVPANQEAMHRQIPGSRLELFEGGHQFYLQDPKAFERIVAFLKGEIED
jgi:3-oxoadipate enol-lactonase